MITVILSQTKKQKAELFNFYIEAALNPFARLVMGQFFETGEIKITIFTPWQIAKYSLALCVLRVIYNVTGWIPEHGLIRDRGAK